MKTARIITVDGLNARFLGAYGNTWVQTPFLDQLASRSIVAEHFLADSFDKTVLMHRLACHSSPLLGSDSAVEPNLFGFHKTTLITDDEEFASKFGNLFHSVDWVQAGKESLEEDHAESQTETHFERLFSVAALCDSQDDVVERNGLDDAESELVWIHSSGMSSCWDAPLEMQEHFKDDSDPPPRPFVSAPYLKLDHDFDPDQRTEILHAYAAEIRSLDDSLGRYFEALESLPESKFNPPLTLFCGLRGFPLGEHLHVGIPNESEPIVEVKTSINQTKLCQELYCESLHVPFFLATNVVTGNPIEIEESASQSYGYRVDGFLQTADIGAILTNWLESPDNAKLDIKTQPIAISTCKEQSRIQTDEWSLILTSTQASNPAEQPGVENGIRRMLFAKPDDRLEINEVSDLCEEIADELEVSLNTELLTRGLNE